MSFKISHLKQSSWGGAATVSVYGHGNGIVRNAASGSGAQRFGYGNRQ